MKAVFERLEYTWWNFHIKVMDETPWIRETLPKAKEIWEARQDAMPYLAWSLLGFPLGIVLGLLTFVVN